SDFEYVQSMHNWIATASRLAELEIHFPISNHYTCDVGILMQSLVIKNGFKSVPCPLLRRLKVSGSTVWPSVLLRVITERSASKDDLRAREFHADGISLILEHQPNI